MADNLFSSFTLITSKHESSSARISSAGLDSDIPRTTAEKKLVRQLENYFAGKKTAFDLRKIPIDRTGWKLFQSRVADALAAVRYGTTISYAELAMVAGHPRASRAVGNCMAANPYPVIIPCHRVVRSDGSLGKFSAGRGWKARLLSLEGLPFSE
ncbi:MAG: methylated-DNA--[protein]-cysteine S-methyltransferase [Thermoleophilia bacterium]|nr:methylated-DNA--[protein]-cysteine S-methyltransferase [Thermoleophilia bacterium]